MPRDAKFNKLRNGIKTNLAVLNYELSRTAKSIPRTLFLCLTYRCQLNCAHCNYKLRLKEKDISLKKAVFILRKAREADIPRIVLFGGEPLLHPDIEEIAAKAASMGFFVELDTNGLLLTEKRLSRLMNGGVSALMISVHSANPVKHDKIEKTKSHSKIKEAVKKALEKGFLVYLSACVFNDTSEKEILQLKGLAKKWGVHGIRALKYVPREPSETLNPRKAALLKSDGFFQSCFSVGEMKCGGQKGELIFVDMTGETKRCPYARKSEGNVFKEKKLLFPRRQTAKNPPCEF